MTGAQCRLCDANIYFDKDRKSKRGKQIPLDPDTSEPHECQPSKPKESKSLGQVIKDSEKRVSERHAIKSKQKQTISNSTKSLKGKIITPKISNKLKGSLGELYYKEYCDQKGWAYVSLEDIYTTMNKQWIFTFKKGFHRINVTIPKKLREEIEWRIKPTNNSRSSPSFVFDFLACKVETTKDYSKVKSSSEFTWAEIKTGRIVFSSSQVKAMSKTTLPLAIFIIDDVLESPEEIEMKWNVKLGSEWILELEPIDNEIYEFVKA